MFRDLSARPIPVASRRPGATLRRCEVRVETGDGVQLVVRDHRPRRAERTVVFLHGFCLSGGSWAGQIAYLRCHYRNRVRVISYDHRGHGDSARASLHTYRIDQLADDLAKVLVALDVTGPVALVGHSMGAMVALSYLARSAADRPVDPDGLVLVAAAAGRLTRHGLGRLLAMPPTTALLALVGHAPEQVLNSLPRTLLSTAVGFLPSLRDYDQIGVLDSIRARTVVVSGGEDLLTPAAHAYELAAAIPGAVHVHIRGAGHLLPQQVPHMIDEAIQTVMAMPRGAMGSSATRPRPRTADMPTQNAL